MNKLNLALATAALTLTTHVAQAQSWPTSVVGSWNVRGNLNTGTLNITTQAGSGRCRAITGTVYGNPIQGFYCVNTGRIYFARKLPANNDTVQVWSGHLSETAPTLLMGGTFASIDSASGGTLGEYAFSATK